MKNTKNVKQFATTQTSMTKITKIKLWNQFRVSASGIPFNRGLFVCWVGFWFWFCVFFGFGGFFPLKMPLNKHPFCCPSTLSVVQVPLILPGIQQQIQ